MNQSVDPNKIYRVNDELTRFLESCAYLQIYGMKKHHASRLHYDLRLGWNGELLSWAVPLGPSYCPKVAREAIEAERHRKKYLGFEGVYPKGRPGAGVTMLWDVGYWAPMPGHLDVNRALRLGELRFGLKAEKLIGIWMLLRTSKVDFLGNAIWMLTKEQDRYARCPGDIEIVQEMPDNLKGQSLEMIERQWHQPRLTWNHPTLFDM